MTTAKLQLETLTCPTCIKKIEKGLGKMNGVEEAKVLFSSSKVKVTFNEEEITKDDLKITIEKLGYEVIA